MDKLLAEQRILCGIFMGMVPVYINNHTTDPLDVQGWNDSEGKMVIFGDFKPDQDWNELIDVCRKLDRLAEDKVIPYTDAYSKMLDEMENILTRNYNAAEVFPVVVNFIEWFNVHYKK